MFRIIRRSKIRNTRKTAALALSAALSTVALYSDEAKAFRLPGVEDVLPLPDIDIDIDIPIPPIPDVDIDFPEPHRPHRSRGPLGNRCLTPAGISGPGPWNPIGSYCTWHAPFGVFAGEVVR